MNDKNSEEMYQGNYLEDDLDVKTDDFEFDYIKGEESYSDDLRLQGGLVSIAEYCERVKNMKVTEVMSENVNEDEIVCKIECIEDDDEAIKLEKIEEIKNHDEDSRDDFFLNNFELGINRQGFQTIVAGPYLDENLFDLSNSSFG